MAGHVSLAQGGRMLKAKDPKHRLWYFVLYTDFTDFALRRRFTSQQSSSHTSCMYVLILVVASQPLFPLPPYGRIGSLSLHTGVSVPSPFPEPCISEQMFGF